MSSTHQAEFHAPTWHYQNQTPVIDGKYIDRDTGETKTISVNQSEFLGPPAVDVVIRSQHEDTTQCVFRASRAVPMEALLGHIMGIVGEKKLQLDSVMATAYAIRVVLSHELTPEEFGAIAVEMVLNA
ncbi:hypothetical protein AC578_7554 [Pseudocercospora eumusae]|uniref:Uncharacterized protein n=1 Tax=Pseudocercospora eumusae TaxID=321146 RepID=A0A139HRS9_9PEZI|nr:hypothetical protein AC578_7554 [Pseudocercospora eumusae]